MPTHRRWVPAALAALTLAGLPASAPASPKPCRDPHGRVITCPRPKPAPTPRARDGAGRFARPVPAGTPKPG